MPENEAYGLTYTWRIEGPIDLVFYYLGHATTFPDWWKPVFLESHSDSKEPFVGAKATVRVKSILPYVLDWDLVVSRLEPPHLIELDSHVTLSHRFELTGPILYRLIEEGPIVRVESEQSMRPKRSIPWLLRPLAARAFRFNHGWAMAHGQRGLQKIVRQTLEARRAEAGGSRT